MPLNPLEIKKNPKLIVILGMHRSGTSAITRALEMCGVCLGDRLMPPNEAINPKGFFEDLDINALNIEMLDAIGSDWHRLGPIESWHVHKLNEMGYLPRAIDLLLEKTSTAPIFAFKDPRTAKLLSFWAQVFDRTDLEVSYLLALRNPRSVVQSLVRRDGFSGQHGYLLWVEHVLQSLKGTVGATRVLADYDFLIENPEREVRRIASVLGLDVDEERLNQYCREFLDVGLRHFAHDEEDLRRDSACPVMAIEMYGVVHELAKENDSLKSAVIASSVAKWSWEFDRMKPILALMDTLLAEVANLNQEVTEREQQATRFMHERSIQLRESSELLIAVYFRYSGNSDEGGYGEDRTVRGSFITNGDATTINLMFPHIDRNIGALRLDIANAPCFVTLHGLSLHQPSGEPIWHWKGEAGLFADMIDMVCWPEKGGLEVVTLGDDPQCELRIPDDVLVRIGEGYILRLEITARPLLEALPMLLMDHFPHTGGSFTTCGTNLPATLTREVEDLAGALRSFVERKNALIAAQRAEIHALQSRMRELAEHVVRAEAQLDLLKEFALSATSDRLERL